MYIGVGTAHYPRLFYNYHTKLNTYSSPPFFDGKNPMLVEQTNKSGTVAGADLETKEEEEEKKSKHVSQIPDISQQTFCFYLTVFFLLPVNNSARLLMYHLIQRVARRARYYI
jgi:hypothetical protein